MGLAVVHHTFFAHRGGAARVANLLHQRLGAEGVDSRRTAEVADAATGCTLVSPDAVAAVARGALIHLHATADWLLALSALRGHPRVVITLHDAALLTGGCIQPFDCPGWHQGCLSPCPRGYANAEERQRHLRELLYELAPYLVSPSGWLARMVRQALPGLPCAVVPNGVSIPETIDAGAARRALGIGAEAFVVLCLAHGGETSQLKGGGLWTTIWDAVKQAVPNALGVFVGGDAMRRDGDLLRLPYLDQAHLHIVRAAADVFIHPSLADNHPLGILEAMAAGLPVCAFDVGGVPEIVRDGVTGRLVPVGDAATLALVCAEFAAQPHVRRGFGKAARDLATRCFDERRMARDYLRVYGTLKGA